MMTSSSQAVAVRSERIATCMTCPICNKLFKNATTITECLHTFCRKCIYGKIAEEGLGNCPECKVYLGCAPLKKLRADHSVQDFKAAIFDSLKRREPNPLLTTIESMEPEVMPTSPLLSRSKERSLSSLVSQPKASYRAATSRRKKSLPRKFVASRGSTLSLEELMTNREAIPENSSPLVTLTKIAENRKPNFCAGESSKQNVPCECAKAPVEPLEGMTALWKPLNCLVETAGITKPGKSIVQESVANSALPIVHEDEENANKITKLKERANKSKVNNDEGRPIPVPSGSEKPKKNRRGRPKRAMATEGTNIAPQAVVNAASTMCHRKVHPIWLSLIPSDAQLGSTSFF
ncbi:hypothetical protein ACSBR1_031615 [Camellia fascicularis]